MLEFEKLREVCGDYQQLGYAKGNLTIFLYATTKGLTLSTGAVLLPLSCAKVFDPDNLGLEHWQMSSVSTQSPGPGGASADDIRTTFLRKRMQCYDLVKDSLTVFEDKCNAQLSNQTGQPSGDDPEVIKNHSYELAFASDDEMFHSVLYDWLIERSLADDLLEVR